VHWIVKMMNVIKDIVYRKLQEYRDIPISDEKRICQDLSIYGDDFGELIEELSNELKFNINSFFNLFDKKNFYNPSEFYLKLPKIFHIDIGKLLKGKIVYQTIDSKGNDITVNELIQLLQEIIEK
jgi:hypothetical protein